LRCFANSARRRGLRARRRPLPSLRLRLARVVLVGRVPRCERRAFLSGCRLRASRGGRFGGGSWARAAAAAGAWVWPKWTAALSLCGWLRARRARSVWVAWGGLCIGEIQGRAAVVSVGACGVAVGGGKGCQRSSSALAALAALAVLVALAALAALAASAASAAPPPWGSCRGPGLSGLLLGIRSARPHWAWPPRPVCCSPVVAPLPSSAWPP
jgi:hypothetical protein